MLYDDAYILNHHTAAQNVYKTYIIYRTILQIYGFCPEQPG